MGIEGTSVYKLLNSPDYKVRVFRSGVKIFDGILVAPISIQTESQWEAMYEHDHSGVGEKAAQFIFGKSLMNRMFTAQSWAGTQIPQINLQIGLIAIYDEFDEVLSPAIKALIMNLPADNSFNPPVEIKNSDDRYKVFIGSMIRIPSLLPVSTNFTPIHTYGEHGLPVSGTLDVVFQPDKAISAVEMKSWFGI